MANDKPAAAVSPEVVAAMLAAMRSQSAFWDTREGELGYLSEEAAKVRDEIDNALRWYEAEQATIRC